MDTIVLELLLLAFLVACSALLTGAEAAYFSLGRSRLKRTHGEGDARAPLIERPHDLLVTLLIGITLINIGASAIAATVATRVFGERFGLLAEVIGMILVLTTFGEVLPMTVAVKYPEQFLRVVQRPVSWLASALRPVRAVLGAFTTLTIKMVGGGRVEQPELSEEELRTLVDVGASVGVVERDEREM